MKYVYTLSGTADSGYCETCGPDAPIIEICRYNKETKKQMGYIDEISYQELDFEEITEEQWMETHRI